MPPGLATSVKATPLQTLVAEILLAPGFWFLTPLLELLQLLELLNSLT
jgi:hypothetical protein